MSTQDDVIKEMGYSQGKSKLPQSGFVDPRDFGAVFLSPNQIKQAGKLLLERARSLNESDIDELINNVIPFGK